MTEVAPSLKPGEKIHYPIFHDETCVYANDLDSSVWMREGEQPIRSKGRGRIVHVSDFIIEHSGRLRLSEAEIAEQMKLPIRPSKPTLVQLDPKTEAATTSGKKSQTRKKNAKKANAKTSSTTTSGRTFTEHGAAVWTPPPPPAPFKAYRLAQFDACHIIYPGANYDPWWDMPQLIVQVGAGSYSHQ